ncbi:MAG: hypothetical protein IJ773_07020 [Lachnospiraceae bacterium]|nr:hypothetical protein [Lachnospiraceae bacterium]
MSKTKIADIYAGLPDAKEAIQYEGIRDFMDAFVIPPEFPLDEGLARGNKMFITGNKGMGKTAALRYLNDYLSRMNKSTKSSFMLFEQDYNDRRKAEMLNQARSSLCLLGIEPDEKINQDDFSYIWRWHIFMTILRQNGENMREAIFLQDDTWKRFNKLLFSVIKPDFTPTLSGSLSVGLPFFGPIQPEITLNLPEIRLGKGKGTFEEIMEEATDCFKELIRFNSPYYLFIDELDVYRGQREEYLRDLRMVRDLIREVKFLNRLMQTAGWNNTKLFCTIRPEVIHAIDRELSGNIGRQITGFDCPLTWFRNTRETYTQPIMHLLMRRIELAEEKNGERIGSEEERYKRWFPQGETGEEPSDIFRRITWSRPRDIVRFLICAGNRCGGQKAFSETVFQAVKKDYSFGSLEEVKTELLALYTVEEVEAMFDCLRGLPACITLADVARRTESMKCKPVSVYGLQRVLGDLYRVGVIGQKKGNILRWQHEGDDGLFYSGDWEIVIHPGLCDALYIQEVETSAQEQAQLETQQHTSGTKSTNQELQVKDSATKPKDPVMSSELSHEMKAHQEEAREAPIFGLSEEQYQLLLDSRKTPSLYFQAFTLKTNGKTRELIRYKDNEYGEKIRQVHETAANDLQKQYRQHEASYAYRAGGSIEKCVSAHVGSTCFLKFDIHHFFNSIDAALLASEIRAQLHLTALSKESVEEFVQCFFIDGILPLGLVISPLLSDIYLHSLDENMETFCRQQRCIYSRYADDIMISGVGLQMDQMETVFSGRLSNLLKEKKLEINPLKTQKMFLKESGQYIRYVGINIVRAAEGNVLTVGRSYIHQLAKDFLDFARRKDDARTKNGEALSEADQQYLFYQGRRLAGKVQFVKQVEGDAGVEKILRRIQPHWIVEDEADLMRFCLGK